MVQPLWERLSLKTLNVDLPYDREISFLSTYPREMKAYVDTETGMQTSIAA